MLQRLPRGNISSDIFSLKDKYPWIGVYDAKDEGTFINVDRTPRTWPVTCGFTSNDGVW